MLLPCTNNSLVSLYQCCYKRICFNSCCCCFYFLFLLLPYDSVVHAVVFIITDAVISALFPAAPVTALVIADCSYTPAIIAIVVIVIYFDSDTIFDTIAPVDAADLFLTDFVL